jgi:LuxR family maltose regulon positive regulatory protein
MEHHSLPSMRFALTKFCPAELPGTLVERPMLLERLSAGAGKCLTVVVGSAGAGKSVLLSSWAAARGPGATSWMSCDRADQNPVRFWAGFIEAPRAMAPGFGADAADLLAMDHAMSADVTASIANDAAKLPAGSAVILDDFHYAAAAVSRDMADLVERWPARTVQLVLASRVDPPLRLHRLRMSGELCELRDRDLYFSLAESRALLANFGVRVGSAELALLHERSEGWAAALQMAALSLRGTADPARIARALDIRSHGIAEYFVSEVLEQQPPEVVQFMLDISVLGTLTAEACAAVTGRQDTAVLLRRIDAANLFLVAQDEERTVFRYHHLVRQVLRAELRARDRDREQALRVRAAEWFEAAGETRRAARYFLTARQVDRALGLLQDQVVPDFLRDPALAAPLDLSTLEPSLLAVAPDRLLGLAADLLLSGDWVHGGKYLDLAGHAQPPDPPEPAAAVRFMVTRSLYYGLTGRLEEAAETALAARAVQEKAGFGDGWDAAVPLILMRVYTDLGDYEAVQREAAVALALPELAEPPKLVLVPGARALAWFEEGHLAQAAEAAEAAGTQARRLGLDQHFTVDYLRALAGLALEQRDLDTAERLIEHALSIMEGRRPVYEFLALLDRAGIWAARGHVREALATVEAARRQLPAGCQKLLARADELEAVLRLALGDLRTPAGLADGLPAARRGLLLARIALTAGDHQAARDRLQELPLAGLTPRHALVRELLLAGAAIGRGDPMTVSIVGHALQAARRGGFLNTVVTAAPQVPSYLIEHAAQLRPDPFAEQLIAAALDVHARQVDAAPSAHVLAEPLTAAEQRILRLLPTSTYLQIAGTLYISRNTVKTHLRSIYSKLGVTSRAEAIERAADLRLL